MEATLWDHPSCNRCGNPVTELSRLTIHRDTDLQEKETSYYDLCPRCMKHLDAFLTTQTQAVSRIAQEMDAFADDLEHRCWGEGTDEDFREFAQKLREVIR